MINKIKDKAILAVLPLLYVISAFAFLHCIGTFYIHGPDPVYAYLMNGLNLANGKMVVGHVDHPGTPVQCLAALIIFIKHLFSASAPLYKDVLLHPESYLCTISIVFTLLIGLSVYCTGRYILKHTSSIGLGLLFQIMPLCAGFIEDAVLPRPESLIIIVGTFFMAYLYVSYIVKEKADYKTTILAGVFTGCLIACKFTCIPITLLVLFLLSNYKERLLYLVTVTASFFIFIIPALSAKEYMWHWVRNLATHDGHYGNGSNHVVNLTDFKAALLDMFFGTELAFPVIYAIITLAFILACLSKKGSPAKQYIRAITGAWIAITFLILVVAKHYAFYYLRPAQICLPFALAVSHRIFLQGYLSTFYARIYKFLVPALGVALCLITIPNIIHREQITATYQKPFLQTQEFLKTQKNVPVIIELDGRESAFLEPSLYFGIVYSGNQRHKYFEFLKDVYPNSYIYDNNFGQLYQWDEETISPLIFEKNSKVLVYFERIDEGTRNVILDKICTLEGRVKLATYKKVYSDNDPVFKEDIYEIQADTALEKKLMENKITMHSDMENSKNGGATFLSSDSIHYFRNGFLNHDEHHSGTTSVEMNRNHPYSLDMIFKVTPGSFVNATVWRKPADGNGGMVMSSKDESVFYKSGAARIHKSDNGWQQIEMNCTVPADYKEDSLHFYLYYGGIKSEYYDDVNISIYPMVVDTTEARK